MLLAIGNAGCVTCVVSTVAIEAAMQKFTRALNDTPDAMKLRRKAASFDNPYNIQPQDSAAANRQEVERCAGVLSFAEHFPLVCYRARQEQGNLVMKAKDRVNKQQPFCTRGF
ncbi:hypothetical protein WJX79_007302 [Trebouxia sp. C0005]